MALSQFKKSVIFTLHLGNKGASVKEKENSTYHPGRGATAAIAILSIMVALLLVALVGLMVGILTFRKLIVSMSVSCWQAVLCIIFLTDGPYGGNIRLKLQPILYAYPSTVLNAIGKYFSLDYKLRRALGNHGQLNDDL